MRRVYAQAMKVHVWLGDGDNDSIAIAIDLAKVLSSLGQFVGEEQEIVIERISHGSISRMNWHQLGALFERPWFSRVWVWQEIALCAHIDNIVVLIGKHKVPWKTLATAASYAYHTMSVYPYNLSASSRCFFMELTRIHFQERGCTPLYNVMKRTRGRALAQDPRDHIYGFFGISIDAAAAVNVDYSKPIPELFIEVTKFLILNGYRLAPFGMLCNSTKGNEELPSWVPNYSARSEMPSLSLGSAATCLFSAGGRREPELRFEKLDKQLVICGRRIGMVTQIMKIPTMRTLYPNGVSFLKLKVPSVAQITQDILYQKGGGFYAPSGGEETWPEAFSRTMFNDCQGRRKRDRGSPPKDIWPCLIKDWDVLARSFLATGGYGEGKMSSEQERLLKYARLLSDDCEKNVAVFFDSRGRIGKAVYNTEMGVGMQFDDEICVFVGAQVPHLIRKKMNGNYAIIGECYVHGIMDGELMEVVKEGDLEDIVLE